MFHQRSAFPCVAGGYPGLPASGIRPARSRSIRALLQGVLEVLELADRLFFLEPVAFLQATDELLAPPVDHVEVVIGQTSPSLLQAPLVLSPVSLNLIPVHRIHLPASHHQIP